jgi:hypothetical protein
MNLFAGCWVRTHYLVVVLLGAVKLLSLLALLLQMLALTVMLLLRYAIEK